MLAAQIEPFESNHNHSSRLSFLARNLPAGERTRYWAMPGSRLRVEPIPVRLYQLVSHDDYPSQSWRKALGPTVSENTDKKVDLCPGKNDSERSGVAVNTEVQVAWRFRDRPAACYISSEWHRPIRFAPTYSGCEFCRRNSASTSHPIRATMSGTASTSV